MRKTLLILTMALISVSLSAQEGLKGIWFAGGQLEFSSSKDKSTGKELKTNNTTVLPIIGGFISPSVAIGTGIGYMGGKTKADGLQTAKSNSFVLKPLVRKYWNITGGLYFFGQISLPMIFGKIEGEDSDPETTTTNIGLEIAPGFDYVVNSWLTIETSFTILNTGYVRSKPKGGEASSSFGFNANPFNSIDDRTVGNLQVGVKFLF